MFLTAGENKRCMNLDPNFASNFKLQQISRVTKEKKKTGPQKPSLVHEGTSD